MLRPSPSLTQRRKGPGYSHAHPSSPSIVFLLLTSSPLCQPRWQTLLTCSTPTRTMATPIQSVAVLPVSLEKDPAGHGQQTASDDRVAPAPPHSTRDKYKQRLARAWLCPSEPLRVRHVTA